MEEAVERLLKVLQEADLRPDRKSFTADGSVLLQFVAEPAAGVDVYPNGDAIVIVRDGAIDHVHELNVNDADRIVSLLQDARK